jgi:hypothetical protein
VSAVLAAVNLIDAHVHEGDPQRVHLALDQSESFIALSLRALSDRRMQLNYGGGDEPAG